MGNPGLMKRLCLKTVTITFIFLMVFLSIPGLGNRISIAQQLLPDLTVPNVWNNNGQICYSLKNAGTGHAGSLAAPVSYYNVLYVDGNQVAVDHITFLLEPGKQVDRCFEYKFQMTSSQHTIKVCADFNKNIKESDEQNNCWNGQFSEDGKEESGQPDLDIIDVWYYGNTPGIYTEIRYTLKNIGTNDAGPSTTMLYIDGVQIGEHHVGGIKAGESRVEMFPFYGQCSEESDMFLAIADGYNVISESDETNNDHSRLYPCPADILLADLDLYYIWHEGEEEYYYTSRQYTAENNIRFRVKNSGDTVSPANEARLFIDGTWSSTHSIPALNPGEKYQGEFNYTGVCSSMNDTVYVIVDPGDNITEKDETNNEIEEVWVCIVQPPDDQKPDLHIRSMWLRPFGDDEYRIGYTIENLGPGYAPQSNTGLYLDNSFKASDNVHWLAPNEQRDEEFVWPYYIDSCTPPEDTFHLIADYQDAIEEENDANNESFLTEECPVPEPEAKADLVVLNVWYEADPGPFPYELYLRYSIKNQGGTAAGPSVISLYINNNEISTGNVPPLDPGEMIGGMLLPDRWTPQWNDNHVQICADVNNNVDEITPPPSGEMNNCLEKDWTFNLSCQDGIKNRDEIRVDCGGAYCPSCNRCDMPALPSRFDWRDHITLPLVRDQGNCGSCWAFAALGAIECTYIVEGGGIIHLSEQFAICEVKGNCGGGCPHDALKYALNTGIVDHNCQPYLDSNSPCNKCNNWNDRLWRIHEYHRVDKSIGAMKEALICYGPLSVGSEKWKHGVVVVGYDDNITLPGYDPGCWIIRNSWGTGYGLDLDDDGLIDDPGYGLIPYEDHDHSDIKKYSHYVIGVMAP